MGELSRLTGTKTNEGVIGSVLNDSQAERVLIKVVSSEDKLFELTGIRGSLKDITEKYLPMKIPEADIVSFLNTLDFSKFKNKMQYVSVLKKEFGNKIDGKMASNIVKDFEVI